MPISGGGFGQRYNAQASVDLKQCCKHEAQLLGHTSIADDFSLRSA
jgi:hypothetical protein